MARTKALFPGETARYRAARNRLLKKEMKLRSDIEKVSAERRRLPQGGAPPEDYVFDSANGPVTLSKLFEPGTNTLMVYNFMFGPLMAEPCPYCSSILDSVDGAAPHVMQRVSLAVVARSPIERILAFARERGWRHLPLLSSGSNAYNRDYLGETDTGDQLPMMNVFTRRRGRVYHAWATEMFFAPRGRGQDPRHVDLIWPVWNLLDMTPEGRGAKWGPKLRY